VNTFAVFHKKSNRNITDSVFISLNLVVFGVSLLMASCTSTTTHRVTPSLAAPPKLSSEAIAQQGKTVERPMAPDPFHFDLPPSTLAVLTNDVASDMGWQEHFILQEEAEGSYTVVIKEGSSLGVQRRVSITPTAEGAEVLILPPDEGIAARIKDKVQAYLTGSSEKERFISPLIQQIHLPVPMVWRAAKQTIVDGGFSFKTADEDIWFIETERVSLGKASRSWFHGVGQLTRVAHPPAVSYDYKSVEWHYRIRLKTVDLNTTEITIAAVIEATPSPSMLEQLTGGALSFFSVPFGSWVSSAATGSDTSRLVLPSQGKLEHDFYAALTKTTPATKEKRARAAKKRAR
jgi:hypothetical protein